MWLLAPQKANVYIYIGASEVYQLHATTLTQAWKLCLHYAMNFLMKPKKSLFDLPLGRVWA